MRQKLPIRACVYTGLLVLVALLVIVEWQVDAPSVTVIPMSTPTTSSGRPATTGMPALFAGQKIYHFYCASCHGANPVGSSSLNNLAAQLAPGHTTDDALYETVNGGKTNSTMPAFRDQLIDEQIWQLIAYLRTVSSPATGSVVLSSSVLTATAAPGGATPPTTRTVPNLPEPMPPLVFIRSGNVWHSDGAAGLLSQLTQFSTGEEQANYVAYSAKSERVAFTTVLPPPNTSTTHQSAGALYTIKLDGSDKQLVWQTDAGELQLPAWTPDGMALYVGFITPLSDAATDGRTQVVRLDLANGQRQTVVRSAHSPTISLGGQHLAYLAEQGYTTSLVVANLNSGDARTLDIGAEFSGLFAPRFTANGTALLFTAVGGPETGRNGFVIPPVAWTPHGILLGWLTPPVAEAHGGPVWDIWRINLDGTNLQRLTTLAEDLPMAVESPDGAEIIVMAYGGLYRMRADGGDLRRVSLLSDHGALDWVSPVPR